MRVRLARTLVFGWLALGTGCDDPDALDTGELPAPTEAKASAEEVEAPAEAAKTPLPEVAPEPVAVELVAKDSAVEFVVTKATGEHPSRFESFSSKAAFLEDDLHALEMTIEVASVKSDVEAFAMHLQAKPFLNQAEHPKATFVADSITPGEAGKHAIEGRLTLRGTERPTKFDAQIETREGRHIAEAELAISLRDYGITNPLIEAEMVDDEVSLRVHLEFQAPAKP